MIDYKQHILGNGLTVLANHDRFSKMAAVNILYRVGARNESPEHTGFAHLFEHLMFRGTKLIPDFDTHVQSACGENNAFTNNDYTDYYITLPRDNVETALWLESDRMTGLDITRQSLETEKMVVIEEYNQRYRNQPYGDQWLLLREMAYKMHPYRWPTIGLSPDHIANATMDQVKQFYGRYYVPSNAILAISGDLEPDRVFGLAEKWFGDLPATPPPHDDIPQEPVQTSPRRTEVAREVPFTQITIAFPMCSRMEESYYRCDMISDILAGGTSSRLQQRLVKSQKLFAAANAYITGDLDNGLFIITGQLLPEVEVERAEKAIWNELDQLKNEVPSDYELSKVKNKFEANTLFGELNVMNKALNLCYYSMLGEVGLINREVDIYRSVSSAGIMETARDMFVPQKSSTLIIKPCK